MNLNEELKAEMAEVEQMVEEAKKHEDYTEKYFILREGMIKLAGGFVQAALLSSLLGWTRHWLKTDNEVYKQIKDAAANNDIKKVRRLKQQIRQGWFWKAYREMASELLDQVSAKTCERYIDSFIKKGLIESREPEEKAIYRAKWYKANIDKIKQELNKLGFELDYFKDQKNSTGQNVESGNTGVPALPEQNNEKLLENSIGQNDECVNTEVLTSESQETSKFSIRQNDEPSRQNVEPSRQNDEHLLNTSFKALSFTQSSDDDDATRIPEKWETDSLYQSLRSIFTAAGASDIKKPAAHYSKFTDAVQAIGFGKLISAAEEYIATEGKQAQIVYFLSGHYNQYTPKQKPASKKKSGSTAPKMPKAIKAAVEETAVTSEPEISEEEHAAMVEDIKKTMAFLKSTEPQVLLNKN